MPRKFDSLDRLLKIASAPDPGAQAMAAAAQTAGGIPGATPAPAMPPPAQEEDAISPDAMKLQNEVAKRDKEISDLRAKVQDAKNQAALVEMKQQMSDEQNKMRDAMRKEYTQMQDKLRAQQKELDNRQALFKKEEANHKAIMTSNEAQHKSRLAEIANAHKTTLQQQVADQKITLAKNEAKSLQEIANQQSQSRLQQADEYVSMTDKARKDAERIMQEKEKRFAATHPAMSPLVQGRINDATSAISRITKNTMNDSLSPLSKIANAAETTGKVIRTVTPVAHTANKAIQATTPKKPQQQAKTPYKPAEGSDNESLMKNVYRKTQLSPNAYRENMDQLRMRDRQERVFAGYDQQFGANNANVAEADMGIARAENALARAKAEGNTERAAFLQKYIDRRKTTFHYSMQGNRRLMDAGNDDAKANYTDYKLQNKKDLIGNGGFLPFTGVRMSDRDRAANRYYLDKQDKAWRDSWWNNRVTRFATETWTDLKHALNNSYKSIQARNMYGAQGGWFTDPTFENATMQKHYRQAAESRGLYTSRFGILANPVLAGIDPALDVMAATGAVMAGIPTGGAGTAAVLAANAARKAAMKGLLGVGKKYLKRKAVTGAVMGVGGKIMGSDSWLPGHGRGYADTRYYGSYATGGNGSYDPYTGTYYDSIGLGRDDSNTMMSYNDVLDRRQQYGY